MNNMNNNNNNFPSICIPRTFSNVSWKTVKHYFEEIIGPGTVERVDLVRKWNHRGEEYQSVFIHMVEWPNNERAQEVRERLLNGYEIKIVYDEPWFWKCSASKIPKPVKHANNKKRNYAKERSYKQQCS